MDATTWDAYKRLTPIAAERMGPLQEELARSLTGAVGADAAPRILAAVLCKRAADVIAGLVIDEEHSEDALRAASTLTRSHARRLAEAYADRLNEAIVEIYCELSADVMLGCGLDEDEVERTERAATAALLPPITACRGR